MLKIGQYVVIDIFKFCCMAPFLRYDMDMLTLKTVEGVKNCLKPHLYIMF